VSGKKLEIGPGFNKPLKGFVAIDIVARPGVIVADASKPLPFEDGEFVLVYASHILEHIAWYDTVDVLKEWARVLEPGGKMEIWVPNALKICEALVAHENRKEELAHRLPDEWQRRNPDRDICVWASGRTFYGDHGEGAAREASFHRSMFTPRYLIKVMRAAGLIDVKRLRKSRGVDHGWINLGVEGTKLRTHSTGVKS
jgi:SAM-dependent methyltransferase